MKICIWSKKGGSGKTPQAFYFAKEHGYRVATNDFGVYEMMLDKDQFDYTPYEESFKTYAENENVVFDLGGMLSKHSKSIASAINMSDVVIVPVFKENVSISGAVISIREIAKLTPNIVVVATRLIRDSRDKGKSIKDDFSNAYEFLFIKNTITRLSDSLGIDLPIFPTQNTKMYRLMMDKKKSATELMKDPLKAHNWRHHKNQIDQVHDFIVQNYGTK